MNRTGLAYRRSSAEAASGLGLLIALFDTLAGDLRRAAQAQRDRDIERRSQEVCHAMLIVGYLEDWANRGPGGNLAQELIAFYAALRRSLIEAEIRMSAEMIEQQMARVLDLREQWQEVQLRTEPSGPEVLRSAIQIPGGYPTPHVERMHSSWSA